MYEAIASITSRFIITPKKKDAQGPPEKGTQEATRTSNIGKHTRLADDDPGEDVKVSHEVPPPDDPFAFSDEVTRGQADVEDPYERGKAEAVDRREKEFEKQTAKKPRVMGAAGGTGGNDAGADEEDTGDEEVAVVGVINACAEPPGASPDVRARFIKRCDDLLFETRVMEKVFAPEFYLYNCFFTHIEPVLRLRRQAAKVNGQCDDKGLQALESSHGGNKTVAKRDCNVDVQSLLNVERARRKMNTRVQKEATEAKGETTLANAKSSALHKQVQELNKALHTANQELHQAADGHNDINSVFPTGTEIQQKVEGFGAAEITEVVLDILCPKLDVTNAAEVIKYVMQTCNTVCIESIAACEANILLALGGGQTPVTKSKLLVGLLKRATQANWTTICHPSEAVGRATTALIRGILGEFPCFDESLAEPLTRAVLKAVETFCCALLNDQGYGLDPERIGSREQFDPTKHVGLDEKPKEGSAVVVMFPALMCKDRITVKALVLAEGYDIR